MYGCFAVLEKTIEFPFSFCMRYDIMRRMMKQTKQLVFIDDSGDPGFKTVSSSNFVMAAALFMDPEIADALSRQILEYRRTLGWRDDYEFKFAKIRKDIIVDLLKMVANYDFQIYAVHINKSAAIKFEDSVDNNLIQLADIIVGSIGRYVNASKTDYATYIGIIRDKIVQLKCIDQR